MSGLELHLPLAPPMVCAAGGTAALAALGAMSSGGVVAGGGVGLRLEVPADRRGARMLP